MLKLTCNTGEKLTCKVLNLAAGKGNKIIALEKVKDTLSKQVGDDADMFPEFKAVPQVNALVPIALVIRG